MEPCLREARLPRAVARRGRTWSPPRPRRAGPFRAPAGTTPRTSTSATGTNHHQTSLKTQPNLPRRNASAEGAGGKRKWWTECLVPRHVGSQFPQDISGKLPQRPLAGLQAAAATPHGGDVQACVPASPWLRRDPGPPTPEELPGVGARPGHQLAPRSPAPVGAPAEPAPPPQARPRAVWAHEPSHSFPVDKPPSTTALGARGQPRCVCREAANRPSRSGHHGKRDPGWTDATSLTTHASHTPQDGRKALFQDGSRSPTWARTSETSITKQDCGEAPQHLLLRRAPPSPGRGRQLHGA